MAKELPYFKFEPSQWENGNIQMCSFEAQGVFVNVCSMYWQRLGELPYKLAVQKICKGNATAFDSLITDQIIKVIDGMICIDFLNEQLSEFENVSETNSKNARDGWKKRRKKATPMRPHSDPNAIREEEIREDERKEYITIDSQKFFDVLPVLEFYEASLNGRQKEHETRAWKDVLPEWFRQNHQMDFTDKKHVFNSFSKYLIGSKPQYRKESLPTHL